MSFFEEIKKQTGITDLQLLNGFSYVNFSGQTLYVEGVMQLNKISNECIILKMKNADLEISGDLKVEDLNERSIVISGRIDNVCTRRL